jgi:transposase-like protein
MQSFEQFEKDFPTDDACKAYIVLRRWPNGVHCPRCQRKERVYALKTPYRWTCCNADCGGRKGYRFSVTTGTIFQDTKVSLRLWFKIGYLMLTAKKGISSLQVRRVIFGENSGTAWRTAWYICHRWRAAMHGDMFPLDGVVEVDEAYLGGKQKNRHAKVRAKYSGRGGANTGKVTVIGAISRKGSVVAQVIENTSAETLSLFVEKTVSDKVSLIATDENVGYGDLKHSYPHQVVNHKAKEYVRGNVHTNNIESFWSLLKRGVVGTYHKVSKDYLPLYLNEFSYRHNNRDNPDAFANLIETCDQ